MIKHKNQYYRSYWAKIPLIANFLSSWQSRSTFMIPYTHKTHPRATKIKITIKPSGEIIVTSPRFAPQWQITKFVESNLPWIEKTLAKLRSRRSVSSTDSIQIFGNTYQKAIEYSSEKPVGIYIERNRLVLNPLSPITSQTWTPAHLKQLNRFLKNTATNYIVPRTHQLAEKMTISFKNITLKEQSTRWGSCSSQGNLNFNWRLVHFEPTVIDYVIIHELAHRTHMDHSSRFWALVRKFDPEYARHKGVLKRSSIEVD